jgi:small subunit ribosomal protein S16
MISIRLTRLGRRNHPFYRIVVADSRRARDGRFVEILGHYDPVKQPAELKLDAEKYAEWISKGAKPSDTVANLAKSLAKA